MEEVILRPVVKIGAVVLCGGDSRRMGRPKAWLELSSTTLLDHMVRLIGTVSAPVVVAARPRQLLPNLPADVTVVRDHIEGLGPLAGIAAAFAVLSHKVDLAYVTAVDSPLLRPAWIARLAELIGDDHVAVPFIDGQYYPLAALYRPAAVGSAIDRLLAEARGPIALVDCVPTRAVTADELREVDPALASLRNVNMPEDYQRILDYITAK